MSQQTALPQPGGIRPRRLAALAAVTLAAGAAFATAPGAVAAQPDATVSLSGWKLTLPVNSSGEQTGAATTVSPAAVTPPWLTRNSSGTLTFWAPTEGATTPNSAHPRTELVDTTDFTAGSGSHTLSADMTMQELPAGSDDIIIGQIHGSGSDSSVPLLMLHYTSGRIWVAVRDNPTVEGTQTATLLTGVPMNEAFSYHITADGSSLTSEVAVTSTGQTATHTITLNSSFEGMPVRWQVGDYQQTDANDDSTDGGRLTLNDLTAVLRRPRRGGGRRRRRAGDAGQGAARSFLPPGAASLQPSAKASRTSSSR